MTRLAPNRWPLALRVPLLVAALMVGAAIVLSQGVLQRLARDQERHLSELSAAYLDGLATAIQPAAVRRDVWEAFDTLDRARGRYAALRPGDALLVLPDHTILAASAPRRFPVGSTVPTALAERVAAAVRQGAPILDETRARATLGRDLMEGSITVGRIIAEVDIAPLLAEREEVRNTLLLANAMLTLLFASIGFWLVRRLLHPLEQLRARATVGGDTGRMSPLPESSIAAVGPEFADLFRAWNRTVAAVSERELMATRMAEEERFAQLGKLASGMAHEVNNPLAGLLTAVDTIATHGDDREVRDASVSLLRRGLDDIRTVVRATLVTYKGRPGDGPLRRHDLDDLRYLVRHEVDRRGITLVWNNQLPAETTADRTLTRQVVLNLLLNACAASPHGAAVRLDAEAHETGALVIGITDAGPGLPPATRAILDGVEAAPPEGGGLGLWIAARLAQRMQGQIQWQAMPVGSCLSLHVPPVADLTLRTEVLADAT